MRVSSQSLVCFGLIEDSVSALSGRGFGGICWELWATSLSHVTGAVSPLAVKLSTHDVCATVNHGNSGNDGNGGCLGSSIRLGERELGAGEGKALNQGR